MDDTERMMAQWGPCPRRSRRRGGVRGLAAVLDHAERGGTLEGAEHPRQIEWTCHQVLARAADARAPAGSRGPTAS